MKSTFGKMRRFAKVVIIVSVAAVGAVVTVIGALIAYDRMSYKASIRMVRIIPRQGMESMLAEARTLTESRKGKWETVVPGLSSPFKDLRPLYVRVSGDRVKLVFYKAMMEDEVALDIDIKTGRVELLTPGNEHAMLELVWPRMPNQSPDATPPVTAPALEVPRQT